MSRKQENTNNIHQGSSGSVQSCLVNRGWVLVRNSGPACGVPPRPGVRFVAASHLPWEILGANLHVWLIMTLVANHFSGGDWFNDMVPALLVDIFRQLCTCDPLVTTLSLIMLLHRSDAPVSPVILVYLASRWSTWQVAQLLVFNGGGWMLVKMMDDDG